MQLLVQMYAEQLFLGLPAWEQMKKYCFVLWMCGRDFLVGETNLINNSTD